MVGYAIEDGIRPLVEAINDLDFASTIYSCEGHFDGIQKEIFLPTAYVTFSVDSAHAFTPLYERLLALDNLIETAHLRLTYDCVLGRYTLSIWPLDSCRQPHQRRAAVDSVVTLISEAVRGRGKELPGDAVCEEATEDAAAFPCGGPIPPCALVIPPKEPSCPFKEALEKGPESHR